MVRESPDLTPGNVVLKWVLGEAWDEQHFGLVFLEQWEGWFTDQNVSALKSMQQWRRNL